ncbi:MAG: uracil phosphoribosyltransferase, partial [Alphaproteobacteria bacterium]|nr:uracil phosphoribosyltransferase [Alphaproteobacteria bacterium]
MKAHQEFPNLYVADHPLILHKLSLMRDVACNKAQFKLLLKEISLLMGYELTRPLPLTTRTIQTPICPMDAPILEGKKPVIVPVLRAGLGMAEGLEELMPAARVGHIGLYRDEKTHEPVEYLVRLPDAAGRIFIMVDPMLATGNSAKHALDVLVRAGAVPEMIRFMALVAAPEGVKVLLEAYPQVKIFVAALDKQLNEKAYIVPGLGDAG